MDNGLILKFLFAQTWTGRCSMNIFIKYFSHFKKLYFICSCSCSINRGSFTQAIAQRGWLLRTDTHPFFCLCDSLENQTDLLVLPTKGGWRQAEQQWQSVRRQSINILKRENEVIKNFLLNQNRTYLATNPRMTDIYFLYSPGFTKEASYISWVFLALTFYNCCIMLIFLKDCILTSYAVTYY